MQYLLDEYNIKIALLSETFLTENKVFQVRDYIVERNDRIQTSNYNPHGGVAILIHKSIAYNILTIKEPNENINAIGIDIKLSIGNISIISLYAKPKHKTTKKDWKLIKNQITNPFIIAGDFNCHHESWDENYPADLEGIELAKFINEECLYIANNGSPTRVKRPHWKDTIIDLTIASPILALDLGKWKVLNNPRGSDHFPIIFNIRNPNALQQRTQENTDYIEKRNYKKTNWDTYQSYISTNMTNSIEDNYNVEETYKNYIDVINNARDLSTPLAKIYPQNKRVKPKWWNSECNHIIAKRQRALSIFNKSSTIENYLEYKKQKANSKKYFNQRKKTEWSKFCETLSPNSTTKEVWETIRCIKRGMTETMTNTGTTEWLEEFAEKTFPMVQTNIIPKTIKNITNPFLEIHISYEELVYSLKHNKNTTVGHDNINYQMLRNIPENGLHKLTKLFNIMLEKNFIPEEWKTHIVVPVPKPNKPKNLATSYRPITLLSCLGKTFESIVKSRLEWFTEHHNVLASTQFGFRRARSVQDNLNILNTDIQTTYAKNHYTIAAFLDIKGAFDNVNIDILYNKLLEINVPNKIANWIYKYYMDRKIYVRYKNKMKGPYFCKKGIPQGSILSPLLYAIYTRIIDALRSKTTEVLQYADDIVIYCIGGTLEIAQRRLQKKLMELQKILDSLQLSVSTNKSNIVIFTRHRLTRSPRICYNNIAIKVSKTVKFLGVWFDTKSNWDREIQEICSKCHKGINLMRCIAGFQWGAHPDNMLKIYKALVRPYLDYSGTLIHSASKTRRNKLERLQHLSLRLSLGFMKSTPCQILNKEAIEPPLHLRRQFLAKKFLIKRWQISGHPIHEKLNKLGSLINKPFWHNKSLPLLHTALQQLLTKDLEKYKNIPYFTYSYKLKFLIINVNMNLFHKSDHHTIINNTFKMYLEDSTWDEVIYTDGSVSQDLNVSACAFYNENRKFIQKYNIPTAVSSWYVELLGILKALESLRDSRNQNILIVSDSKSALESLKNNNFKNNNNLLVSEIKQIYDRLINSGNFIQLLWIPGHKGVKGNEVADDAAKDALVNGQTCNLKEQSNHLIIHMRRDLNVKFNKWYKRKCKKTAKSYFKLNPNVNNQLWFNNNDNRDFITTINRLKTNHNKCPYHLKRIGVTNSSDCACGEEATAEHLILQCELNSKNNSVFYNQLIPLVQTYPINLDYLLYNGKDLLDILYRHIKCSDINI